MLQSTVAATSSFQHGAPWNTKVTKLDKLPKISISPSSTFTYSSFSSYYSDDDSTSDEMEDNILLFDRIKLKSLKPTKSSLSQLLVYKPLSPQRVLKEREGDEIEAEEAVENSIPICVVKRDATFGSFRIDREPRVTEGRYLISHERWQMSNRFRFMNRWDS
jgi:hypothetical protein